MFSILWVIPEPIWNKLTIRFSNKFNDNYRANRGNFKEFQSKILLIYLKFSILPDGPDIIQIHVTFWQTTYVSAITLNFSWRTIIRMVVRNPGNSGKPGIHLEFENSTWNTWKTWNLYEKVEKTPGIWDFSGEFLFC